MRRTARWKRCLSKGPVAAICAALLGAWGCHEGSGTSASSRGATAELRELEPLLASLRPSSREALPESAGVKSLTEFPVYDLDLKLHPATSQYRLREEVLFYNDGDKPLQALVLRAYGNAGKKAPVIHLEGAHCRNADCSTHVPNPTALVVEPEQPIAPDDVLHVSLRLRGHLQSIETSRTTLLGQGLKQLMTPGANRESRSYGLLAKGDEIISLASFYAVVGSRNGDRWNTRPPGPIGDHGAGRMGHVRAHVDAPRGTRIATTGVVERRARQGDRRSFEIKAGMVRNFALLASERFRTEERLVDGVRIRAHFLPEHDKAGQHVLETAAHALRIFQRRFGRYPYRDLDVAEAPLVGGAGGAEFSGLVSVASMLYKPGPKFGSVSKLLGGVGDAEDNGSTAKLLPSDPGSLRETMREFVVAHEVAHQYWHGLVGSDSRAHPFVDESLSQYSAIVYFEDRYGPQRAKRVAEQQVKINYQVMRMLGHPDGAVDRPMSAFESQLEYAGLVYGKGPYVYRALRDELGDARFFDGLQQYVDRYRFRTAPARGPIEIFADGPHEPRVEAIARHWLEQTHGDSDLGQLELGGLVQRMLGDNVGGHDLMKRMQRIVETATGTDRRGLTDSEPPPSPRSR